MLTYSAPRYLFRRHTILTNVRPAERFLEVGAGNLKLSAELTGYFKEGLAIDFENKVKDYYADLKSVVQKKLSCRVGDFFKIRFDNNYDCIVACEVMEHIENDQEFLSKINSLLNNGGQIIISVPAKAKYWTVHDEIVGHVKRYEKPELLELFKNSGFKNIQILAYGFPFINIFWLARAIHGRLMKKERQTWSQTKQTKASGIGQTPKILNLLGVIFNKYVFYIPNLIASWFNNFNLSEGYVIVARK